MSDVGGLPPVEPAAQAAKQRDTRDNVRIVVAIVLAVLLVAFVLANSYTVTVHFILFKSHVGLIWVLIVTALLGAAVDRLLVWRSAKNKKAAAKAAQGD